MEMNQLNRRQAPDIETVYLMASPQYSFLSPAASKNWRRSTATSTIWSPRRSPRRLKEELAR